MTGLKVTRRGRPELESYTPVNIENGLYRDNGEGVAATPLPYPLESCPGRLRIQPLWKLQTMGLAVPSPVGRERVRVRVKLFELRILFGNGLTNRCGSKEHGVTERREHRLFAPVLTLHD